MQSHGVHIIKRSSIFHSSILCDSDFVTYRGSRAIRSEMKSADLRTPTRNTKSLGVRGVKLFHRFQKRAMRTVVCLLRFIPFELWAWDTDERDMLAHSIKVKLKNLIWIFVPLTAVLKNL